MGIVCNTPPARVQVYFEKLERMIHRNIMQLLSKEGVDLQTYIRDRGQEESWHDVTGNLRSSVGSAIYENGKKVSQSDFAVVADGAEGAQKGKDYVAELAAKLANSISLAVVAGMDYASYVEAMDGKDVLASAETKARAEIPDIIKRAIDNAIIAMSKIKL